MLTILSLWRFSSALLTYPGTIQVKHGCCLYCGTVFWTYHATANRHMIHAFLFIKASPDWTRLLGVLADNCTSSFGRRRPYMLLGSVICAFAMLLLGFTRPVASLFTELGSHSVGLIYSFNNILSYIFLEQYHYNMARYPRHIFNWLFYQRWWAQSI